MNTNQLIITRALPAAGMLAAGFVYVAALGNFLVSDSWLFVYPRSLADTLAYFSRSVIPPGGEALWLRPIPMLFFWLDNKMWPGTSWGPHLTNVIFHVANVWLLWHVVRFVQSGDGKPRHDPAGRLAAAAACLLYGLHPLGVGAVAWVGARFDVMCVTFGLAGTLMWLKWDAGIYERKGFAGAAALLLLGVLSKEPGGVFVVVCALATLAGLTADKGMRKRNAAGVVILAALVVLYLIYRTSVFNGLGGYMQRTRGFDPVSAVYYLVTMVFPFLNSPSGLVLRPTLVLSLVVILAFIPMLWPAGGGAASRLQRKHVVAVFGLFLLGLAATTLRAPLRFTMVLGHAESRYALIAITGLSLIVGVYLPGIIRSRLAHRIALGVVVALAVAFAWRTDAQVRAWGSAAAEAEDIVGQIVRLAPDPKPDSKMIFLNLPKANEQFAYIWGIGLEEALSYKYGRRDNLTVIRSNQQYHMRLADPERDFIFGYGQKKKLLVELDASGQIKRRQ